MTFNGTLHENMYILGVNPPAATDAASFPPSGGYINVSNYPRFAFLVHMGTFDTDGDFRVRSATSKTATLVTVTDAEKTDLANGSDDNKWFSLEVESAKLPTTHRFVTLACATMTGSNDIWSAYFLGWACLHGSPTQSSSYDSHTVVAG